MPFDPYTPTAPAITITGWTEAGLAEPRAALYRLCDAAPDRVPVLLNALWEGRVDGRSYRDIECRCLVGWVLDHPGYENDDAWCAWADKRRDLDTGAAEMLANPGYEGQRVEFPGIRPGDTPATNPVSALIVQWIGAWQLARGIA